MHEVNFREFPCQYLISLSQEWSRSHRCSVIVEGRTTSLHLQKATPARMLINELWHRNASLVDALNTINIPMATIPPGIVQDLLIRFTASADRLMTPGLARQLTAHASSSALQLSASKAAHLLVYSLDEDAAFGLTAADAHGLMVPLLNGSCMPLTNAAQGQTLYLGDSADQQLFDGLSAYLVDTCGLTSSCIQR